MMEGALLFRINIHSIMVYVYRAVSIYYGLRWSEFTTFCSSTAYDNVLRHLPESSQQSAPQEQIQQQDPEQHEAEQALLEVERKVIRRGIIIITNLYTAPTFVVLWLSYSGRLKILLPHCNSSSPQYSASGLCLPRDLYWGYNFSWDLGTLLSDY